MKLYLKSYNNQNLGDDIFIKIFLDRFKDSTIYMIGSKNKYLNKNIKIYKETFFLKFIKKITKNKFSLEKKIIDKADLCIVLGGSMFIEGKSNLKFYNYLKNKQYYILGTNFGPYNSEKYLNYFKFIFKNANDVCFRDKKSYNLFKNMKNIRYAPDIIFSLNIKDIKLSNSKKVIFSIIDTSKKLDSLTSIHYEKEIIKLINYFDKKNYEIILMSFCKKEGDERAIKSIIKKIDCKSLKKSIKKYYYNGNIEEALNVLGDCSIIVGSRFHANILGLLMNKVIIPLAYSDKTINVLNDIQYGGKIFDIRNTKKFNTSILNAEDFKYKFKLTYQQAEAKKHFKIIDEILLRR